MCTGCRAGAGRVRVGAVPLLGLGRGRRVAAVRGAGAAEAQGRIGEAATGIGEQMADTGLAIQRAKDKTEQMQARAAAVDELVASGSLEDFTSGGQTDLDRELQKLTTGTKVDDELAKMKAEVGAGTPQKELEK